MGAASISDTRRRCTSPSPRRVCCQLAASTVPTMCPCHKERLNWSLTRLHLGYRRKEGRRLGNSLTARSNGRCSTPERTGPRTRMSKQQRPLLEAHSSRERVGPCMQAPYFLRRLRPLLISGTGRRFLCILNRNRRTSPPRHPTSVPLPNHNHLSSLPRPTTELVSTSR